MLILVFAHGRCTLYEKIAHNVIQISMLVVAKLAYLSLSLETMRPVTKFSLVTAIQEEYVPVSW